MNNGIIHLLIGECPSHCYHFVLGTFPGVTFKLYVTDFTLYNDRIQLGLWMLLIL